MERLTEFHGGIWGMSVKAVENGYDRYSVFSRLAEYEDTNHTPEQIKEFDKVYLDKCKEVNRLNDRIKQLEYAYNLSSDCASRLTKANEKLSDRVIKAENLIRESEVFK